MHCTEVLLWGGGKLIVFRVFFFFKQKTAYEMLRSLVGSEMCIRDSWYSGRSRVGCDTDR